MRGFPGTQVTQRVVSLMRDRQAMRCSLATQRRHAILVTLGNHVNGAESSAGSSANANLVCSR
jgi:hypothetical protein